MGHFTFRLVSRRRRSPPSIFVRRVSSPPARTGRANPHRGDPGSALREAGEFRVAAVGDGDLLGVVEGDGPGPTRDSGGGVVDVDPDGAFAVGHSAVDVDALAGETFPEDSARG